MNYDDAQEILKSIPVKKINVQEVLNCFPDITSESFDIKSALAKGVSQDEVIVLIQYFYGLNIFMAMEMYAVIVYGKKPINIIHDEEDPLEKDSNQIS